MKFTLGHLRKVIKYINSNNKIKYKIYLTIEAKLKGRE